MIDEDTEIMFHRDFMAKLPEMKGKVEMFDYLIHKGFSPSEIVSVFKKGSREFKLAVDGYNYCNTQK